MLEGEELETMRMACKLGREALKDMKEHRGATKCSDEGIGYIEGI